MKPTLLNLIVHKGKDLANDNHGSKIVVVPFNGADFDRDVQQIVASENAARAKNAAE